VFLNTYMYKVTILLNFEPKLRFVQCYIFFYLSVLIILVEPNVRRSSIGESNFVFI
jgi:hypothetical protein